MTVAALKGIAARRAFALRKKEEEIVSLKEALAVETAAKERALDRASVLESKLQEIRSRVGFPDDDGQPSEEQEWLDFDRDC